MIIIHNDKQSSRYITRKNYLILICRFLSYLYERIVVGPKTRNTYHFHDLTPYFHLDKCRDLAHLVADIDAVVVNVHDPFAGRLHLIVPNPRLFYVVSLINCPLHFKTPLNDKLYFQDCIAKEL